MTYTLSWRHRIFIVSVCTILSAIAMISSGCSSCTKPEEGLISGKVVLVNDSGDPAHDPVDFAGITVALYNLAQTDTALTRLNTEIPQIGIPLNQMSEFDYRREEPVASVTTDGEGNFEFEVRKDRQYNITLWKEGWGMVVRHNITTSGHDGADSTPAREDFGTVNLYPEHTLDPQNAGDITFKSDHTYIVNSDTNILGACNFEGGSRLLLAQAASLKLYGAAVFDSLGMCTWILSKQLPDSQGEIQKWGSLHIYANNTVVSNLMICDATSGVSMYGTNGTVHNVMISSSTNGLYLPSDYSRTRNCLFQGIDVRAIVYNQSVGSATVKHWVERSVFYRCTEGLRTLGQNVAITDNYFLENTDALISFSYPHQIKYNNFDRNSHALVINGSTITIEYNNFFNNDFSIDFSITYYASTANPLIRYNNFHQLSEFVVRLWPRTINRDINATNNYWASSNIPARIWDVDDMPLIEYHLLYLPKSATKITSAGIRT